VFNYCWLENFSVTVKMSQLKGVLLTCSGLTVIQHLHLLSVDVCCVLFLFDNFFISSFG